MKNLGLIFLYHIYFNEHAETIHKYTVHLLTGIRPTKLLSQGQKCLQNQRNQRRPLPRDQRHNHPIENGVKAERDKERTTKPGKTTTMLALKCNGDLQETSST